MWLIGAIFMLTVTGRRFGEGHSSQLLKAAEGLMVLRRITVYSENLNHLDQSLDLQVRGSTLVQCCIVQIVE